MKNVLGKPGSKSGLILRLSQCLFAAASMTAMVSGIGFSSYTSFCYLVASMGLQMLWSFGAAILDIYALLAKRDLNNPILISLFVVGDWVTATLSLSAACSSAGVIVLFSKDIGICRSPCDRFQLSVAFAFITWFLIFTSSLVILWILPSVH